MACKKVLKAGDACAKEQILKLLPSASIAVEVLMQTVDYGFIMMLTSG
jgi:hypothetical protein